MKMWPATAAEAFAVGPVWLLLASNVQLSPSTWFHNSDGPEESTTITQPFLQNRRARGTIYRINGTLVINSHGTTAYKNERKHSLLCKNRKIFATPASTPVNTAMIKETASHKSPSDVAPSLRATIRLGQTQPEQSNDCTNIHMPQTSKKSSRVKIANVNTHSPARAHVSAVGATRRYEKKNTSHKKVQIYIFYFCKHVIQR